MMGKRERRINQTQFEIRTLEDGKTVILEGVCPQVRKNGQKTSEALMKS